jgi:hypothetical protein
MRSKGWWVGAAALALLLPLQAHATIFNFSIPLSGANEVAPNVGDPDGFGTANLSIDDSTAPFPTISWNITTGNIALPPTGAHIHQGAAGTNGPVRVDFLSQLTGSNLQDADLVAVLLDPAGWYVNIHNSEHLGGAIRGQVPEPTTVLLVAGGLALLAHRRA